MNEKMEKQVAGIADVIENDPPMKIISTSESKRLSGTLMSGGYASCNNSLFLHFGKKVLYKEQISLSQRILNHVRYRMFSLKLITGFSSV